MKKRKSGKVKKILFFLTALLIISGAVFIGFHQQIFAYESVTWDGDFQYTTTNWSYATSSYANVSITKGGTSYSEKIYANNGNGFTRKTEGNTKVLTMQEGELASYLRNCGWPLRPGDTVYWSANADVTFRYSGGITSLSFPTVEKANAFNNEDRSSVRNSIQANVNITDANWDGYGYVMVVKDDNGYTGYCHHFSDDAYRLALKKENQNVTIEGCMLILDAKPGGTVSCSDQYFPNYFPGEAPTVVATPNDGYTFKGWYDSSGNLVSTNPNYPCTIPDNKTAYTLTAHFDSIEPQQYTLTTSANPSNGGAVYGNSGSITEGTTGVTVNAEPAEGYVFTSWTSNWSGFPGGDEVVTFTMPSQDVELTANFTEVAAGKYAVTFIDKFYTGNTYDGQGNGNSYTYDKGHVYSFTTKSTTSFSYNGTSGYYCQSVSVSPTDAGLSVSGLTVSGTIEGNVTITREMVKEPDPDITPEPSAQGITVNVVVSPSSAGPTSGSGTYDAGSTVNVGVDVGPAYEFTYWSTSAGSLGYSYSTYTTLDIPDDIADGSTITVTAYCPERGPNTIYYYPNGGSGSVQKEYTSSYWDTSHTLIENPFGVPSGYIKFLGWKRNNTGSTLAPGTTVSVNQGSTSYYAQWQPITYKVYFAKQDIDTTPPEFEPEQIWTYDQPSPMPAKLPDKTYTVSYDLNKKSTMSTQPSYAAEPTEDNTKSVYDKFGWRPYEYVNGDYNSIGSAIAPAAKQNLTTEQDKRVYVFPQWDGGYVTLPVVNCDGYNFYGWTLDANETLLKNVYRAAANMTANYQAKSDCTLYAYYEPKQYIVKLDRQDPNLNLIETVTMTFDAYGPSITPPERLHYTFHGYYTENGTQYYDKDGKATRLWQVHDGSIDTLYAKWVLDTQIIYYANGGVGYMPHQWLDGNATECTLLKCKYSKYGNTFDYWCATTDICTDKNASGHEHYEDEEYVTGIAVSSKLKLYAQWKPNSYTITFDPNGGTVSPTTKENVTYDATYGTLPTPTWDGYEFAGWYTADTNDLITSTSTVTNPSAHTLVARWNASKYTVTFVWNYDYERPGVNTSPEAGTVQTKEVSFGSAYGSLPEPKRDGYEFLGWYMSNDAGGNGTGTVISSSSTVTTASNHKLYAKWNNLSYTLEFDYNMDYRVDPEN